MDNIKAVMDDARTGEFYEWKVNPESKAGISKIELPIPKKVKKRRDVF
ncbi:hypothetical protein GI584_05955 [Gracilibacillus salitolerans]|uniref:Uncharacterized protein n=1 Tax=Gracilibacillus salitolerans TaxID=2663022 RepID=A0A5Q2TG09_9BACI|nr:hypothetical protein [Gracilibacillus salitolerans]QGH33586.1 hypothetical protein GI584_05955 [Gracilibacillus salitolerans]